MTGNSTQTQFPVFKRVLHLYKISNANSMERGLITVSNVQNKMNFNKATLVLEMVAGFVINLE